MNNNTIAIVKSTAPLLKEKGDEITSTMYKFLFERNPEVKDLFKDAEPEQYKKLANAVYAYAANIDNLGALKKGIETMASVHVEKKIQASHYPLVADALLSAIKEVLGDTATPEVMAAWEEAYLFLADVLIKRESELYKEQVA
ncbi:MAG: hemoglobin-like flavoprotein [Sulfurimonas sp.]|jgi:hemoglobin-like flavoprotein|uniref:globin domain-containing protein n=1 Tax=Sulfurimonas sp. TaxID=2022749 RepID=UPI0039E546B6